MEPTTETESPEKRIERLSKILKGLRHTVKGIRAIQAMSNASLRTIKALRGGNLRDYRRTLRIQIEEGRNTIRTIEQFIEQAEIARQEDAQKAIR